MTPIARDIEWLHRYIMWLIVVIFVGVFSFMFYACWAHRTPPAFPPLAGSKTVTGPKEAYIDTVLNGRRNTAMMAFGGQLSDADIAAVITYERNSWGNKAGEVQPAEVRARRR